MAVTILTPAQNRNLTTLARLKTQIGETTTSGDTLYTMLIDTMSEVVRARLSQQLVRQEYQETFVGSGFRNYLLNQKPVVELGDVTLDGTAIDKTDSAIAILTEGSGVARRSDVWTETIKPDWSVEYWAGYLVPDDDYSGATVAFAATGQTLTLSAGTWPLVRAGDRVVISGAGESENSGNFEVLLRTSDTVLSLVATSGIVDEVEGATVSIAFSTLPGLYERACIALVRDTYRSRLRGVAGVTGEKLGPMEVTYDANIVSAAASSNLASISTEAESLLASKVVVY